MNYLILLALLTFVQAPPTPANSQIGTQGKPSASTSITNQNPKELPSVKITDIPPVKVAELPSVTVVPTKRDWADWGYWVFSCLLVIVGALEVGLMWRTLGALQEQGDLIKQQVGIMAEQTKTAEQAAQAAADGAKAANANVEMVISKERARLSVELKKLNLVPVLPGLYTVDSIITIDGTSRASVIEARCAAYMRPLERVGGTADDALAYPLNIPMIIPPNNKPMYCSTIFHAGEEGSTELCTEIEADRLFVECRGSIKYKDVFERERETRFRYVWKYSSLPLLGEKGRYGGWEKCGPAEDNVET